LETFLEGPPTRLTYVHCLRNFRDDERGVTDGGQRDEVDAIDKMVEQIGGNLKGEAGFANAARPREGEQTNLLLEQQLLDGGELVSTADERAAGQRKVGGG
jgi:hypothetical protein